ncbi:MAG: phosphoketolase family protein [Bacilli bacterium]|nr:phosphoketolase family protein [Bacilli bacterium]
MIMKTEEALDALDKYYKAANYISACQLYLLDNPLLKRKLTKDDLKRKIVGHWGTVPAQNFIYAHLNRLIKENNLNMIYISGPGHGGNSPIANTYLEGTYSEIYPDITENEEGLKKLFKQFSFPGGVPSHAAPETPGSIHEGGELGYSLSHAFGAVFDNPDLIVACVVGDGEAETGPLANSWHGNKFINYKTDGIVLPILNLNGYKISNPTVFSRMSNEELGSFFSSLGWHPYLVEGNDENLLHKKMYYTLNKVLEEIKEVKKGNLKKHPMIILKTPKGFTGPKYVDDVQIEGTFRAHQVPLVPDSVEHIQQLEKWLRSYEPEKLFNQDGSIVYEIKKIIPEGKYRMGANPNANGGLLRRDLKLPLLNEVSLNFLKPGSVEAQDMLILSKYIKKLYEKNDNFRLFSPDEAMSNRLYEIFKAEKRDWQEEIKKTDEYLSKNGKIIDSYLSEHFCEGLLEGYLLTGRHGVFVSYEAFINVAASMIFQHSKWLKVCETLPWRGDISSLNLILTSNVWQQDHNGYTHQDPSLLSSLANKKDSVIRMYLPADANSLLVCFDKCMKEKNKINVIVASKHPSYQWLTLEQAKEELDAGLKVWEFASDDDPDLVMACCGDCPTLESLAATKILKEKFPSLKIRFVNILDLLVLKKSKEYSKSLSDEMYDKIFTKDKPIIMNFHGYPSLIHQFTYDRNNKNMLVYGYEEEGTITTPFDMRVKNKIDRYHLVINAIRKLDLSQEGEAVIKQMEEKLDKHYVYIRENGIDMPEIVNFKW